MPISSKAISSAIVSQCAIKKITGRDISKLADVVGMAVSKYLFTPNLVMCNLTGMMGPIGNISSISVVGLVPANMSSMMLSKAYMKSLKGRDIKNLLDAISMGIVQVLMGMMLTGTAAGIGVGTGTGSFSALNDKVLAKMLFSFMSLKKLTGRDDSNLCDAIAFGFVNHLKTSVKFSLMVTGAFAPGPPTGPIPVTGIPAVFTKIS